MRGGPTRRVFGIRTWLVVEAIAALLHLADPRLRREFEEALRWVISPPPYRVEYPPHPTTNGDTKETP